MKNGELVVLWRVFSACNLGCRFCGYSNELRRPRPSADTAELLAFTHVLGEFARYENRRVLVSWLGGEPLLWPDLEHVSRAIRHSRGLELSATTNGIPLESSVIRRLLVDEFREITISVDGLADFHDDCRKSPGLFHRIRDHVLLLKDEIGKTGSNLVIKANTILMRGNASDFDELCRELSTWGVREVTFNQLGGIDRPDFYPANRLLPEQVDRFITNLPAVRERARLKGIEIRGSDRYLHRLEATARGDRLLVRDCEPGQSFLFIDETGRISPCSFATCEYGMDLKECRTVDSLIELPRRFADKRRLQLALVCSDCHSTQTFGKFDQPDNHCDTDASRRCKLAGSAGLIR